MIAEPKVAPPLRREYGRNPSSLRDSACRHSLNTRRQWCDAGVSGHCGGVVLFHAHNQARTGAVTVILLPDHLQVEWQHFFRQEWQRHLPDHLQVEWQHFFRQERQRHLHHQSTNPTGWSLSDIQAFRRYAKAFVVGPGDHFPHTAVLSCPCHYHHLLCKTFIPSPTTSTPVFQPLRHGIHLIKTRLRDVWPPRLLQRYRWGLHWDRRLPSAYILPKHSRDWSKARPIVSYAQTVSAPLSQTVASAIYCLLQIVFPDLTSLSDVLPLLRRIWRVLQHYDPTDDLVLYQQDIAGFFNFVTHPRMISTVEFLITRYASLQGLDLRDDPVLSVAQHQQERLQRIFRGRWRKASRSYHPIHLRDLPDLVAHLLDSSYFTSVSAMSSSFHGLTPGPCVMQCCCIIQRTLFPTLFPHFLVVLCNWIGTPGTLCRQCFLSWTCAYASHRLLPGHRSTLLLWETIGDGVRHG